MSFSRYLYLTVTVFECWQAVHSKVRRSWSASLVGLTRERNIGVPHISQDGDRSRLRRIIEMRLLHGEAPPTRYRRERDFVSPPPTPDTEPVVDDLGFPPDQPHESIREGLKRYSIRESQKTVNAVN